MKSQQASVYVMSRGDGWHKVGCRECKGKGVVFHPCTKADAKYWEEQGRNLQNEPV